MIKILALVLTVIGAIGLIMGVLGIFESLSIGLSPWALIIIGVIFFFAGISMLKRQKDTDEVKAENS